MGGLRFSAFSATAILATALVSALWITLPGGVPGEKPMPQSGIVAAEELADIGAAASSFPMLQEYIEVVGGCGPNFDGEACVRSFAGPGEEYRAISRLRRGVVLKVEPVFRDLHVWYKVVFDESLRYPERLPREQYVSAEDVRHFFSDGTHELSGTASTTKRIIVDRSEQKLYAYEGDALFMETVISTGLQLTPTPRGTFTVYKKTPTRYMQGPLPGVSDQYYDLPGVPWNLYFTPEGGVIHGAYWHDKFGRRWSHGCVNLSLFDAQKLYEWADVGTSVLVRD